MEQFDKLPRELRLALIYADRDLTEIVAIVYKVHGLEAAMRFINERTS